MDSNNTNIAYVCGRLCAITEKAHNLKGNEYGRVNRHTMATEPQSWLKQFVALKHINNKQLDALLVDVLDKVTPDGIPERLNLEDQSRFFVGYYHQRSHIDRKSVV